MRENGWKIAGRIIIATILVMWDIIVFVGECLWAMAKAFLVVAGLFVAMICHIDESAS